ncbi:hypothetical protein FS837_006646 [Tulasnella sp. UAMH 9824]|nr:hypothetical protein FS837_006646 [Tulasnella sp. UAMH 9824]
MLGSTLLSAATALFFLPSVFSAPVAPVIAINSLSVPEVDTTTISTTRGVAIQKVTAVFVEKKAALDAVYQNVVNADSNVKLEWAEGICSQVNGILTDTVTAVQSASTSPVDVVAVDVDISGLVKIICEVVTLVFCILGHVCVSVSIVLEQLVPIIGTVLTTLCVVLRTVNSLVEGILAVVAEVLIKVTGIVDFLKVLVAYDVRGITALVAYLAVEITTISTTKSVTIQKVTEVSVEKKSQLDAFYEGFVKVDASKVDAAFCTEILTDVAGILGATVNGVQAATGTVEDSVAVEVNVTGLIEATVFRILGYVVNIVDCVAANLLPIIASVLASVLFKVEGLVDIIKVLVALNLGSVTYIVAFLQVHL